MSDEFSTEGPDIFDPEVIRKAEDAEKNVLVEQSEAVRAYISRRKSAYANVFSEGVTTKDDLDFVFADLAKFCRGFETTFNTNQKLQDLLEGRKEVYYRITNIRLASFDDQYRRYMELTNATR